VFSIEQRQSMKHTLHADFMSQRIHVKKTRRRIRTSAQPILFCKKLKVDMKGGACRQQLAAIKFLPTWYYTLHTVCKQAAANT
jgi:hypothetical protein